MLLEPKEIMGWGYPNYPDNLCFLKDGVEWFWSVTHEGSVEINVYDNTEMALWKSIGIKICKIIYPNVSNGNLVQ